MSDNSNLANRNIEPSMEDILSSIRKVIAEDLLNEESVSEEFPPEEVAPTAEDATENNEEIANSDEVTSEDDSKFTDETLTLAPLAGSDILASSDIAPDVGNTDIDDILELDSIITELPDPLAMTDEMGEAMELVTLEEDLIDDVPNAHEDTKKQDLENFFADDEVDTKAANDIPEMDIIIAARASTLAQAGISELAEINDLADTDDDLDFDETLDLVMDADASDYVTTKVATKQSGKMEIENWRDRTKDKFDAGKVDPEEAGTDIFGLSLDADAELQANVDATVQKTLMDTLAQKTLIEETLIEETPLEEAVPEESDEQMELEQEFLLEDLAELDLASDGDLDPEPTAMTPDEDMDLVKSLLEDLMDEQAPEAEIPLKDEIMNEAANEALEVDTDLTDFTNEILFRDEPDQNLNDQDILIPEPPTGSEEIDLAAFEEALIDPNPKSDEAHSTLAQIAADVGGSKDISTGTSNPDDIITLEDPGLLSKLALAGSVAAGATVLATTEKTPKEETPKAEISVPEMSEPKATETPEIRTPISTKEDEPMATPLKTDTQDDVGNAFASLTNAVQEKALNEENGPPIGELVKEALKPMLQEWLDKNLKSMVQRAVTKEIKRISSSK